ncbi:MAG: hypothetical protein CME19_23315 [Gemmatimonadetes bacterium]|nr:hypothetical protein [Gemmatimonadota bacterium]
MARYLKRAVSEVEDHDVSKELFLGIMMLMLTLGIMILNVSQPVWRVHHHDPEADDVILMYTPDGKAVSADGKSVRRMLRPGEFQTILNGLVADPDRNLHLYLKGGSRERMVNDAAYADSLLSTAPSGEKVRPAVFVHMW